MLFRSIKEHSLGATDSGEGDEINRMWLEGCKWMREKASVIIAELKRENEKLEKDKDRLSGIILNSGKELIKQDNVINELKREKL